MGTGFALACGDCLEFIALHKWSIVEYFSLPSTKIPSLSNQPIVPVSDRQILKELGGFEPPQPYIEELLPVVRNFVTCHRLHFLFFTCDYGERPWDFGEPRYLEWKEIQAACSYSGQYLPRNLIEDFGFTEWSEVLEYYSEHQAWFLSKQMKDECEALKRAFEQKISEIDSE